MNSPTKQDKTFLLPRRSRDTKSAMLEGKLCSGTFKTKESQARLVEVGLFWMSQHFARPPAGCPCVLSRKGPIKSIIGKCQKRSSDRYLICNQRCLRQQLLFDKTMKVGRDHDFWTVGPPLKPVAECGNQ